ncbi:hypothetical protein DPMN_101648 [Dreissena polymorpha]|uniref:Uncharacterized protein n=1 Tax=Dreissena polymorpha TaxID=45954 RepID=A0A9D4LKA6_DREPO|nr:hypothetical protein DPMN_101648 [Dreissena polymorpha]
MAAPSLTTTSRRSQLSTWSFDFGVGPRNARRRTTPPQRRTNIRRRRSSLQFSSFIRLMRMARSRD